MMRNHPVLVEIMIAASISVTVFVPINPRTKGEKLAYTLRNAGCREILLAGYNLAQLEEIRGSLPDLSFIPASETGEDGAPALEEFRGAESLDEVLGLGPYRTFSDPLILLIRAIESAPR
jgi:crotonobetaine/carnitine-CoA ligase